jgi:anti-anti-sigma regulatory factor
VSLPSLRNSEWPPNREPWAKITPSDDSVSSTSASTLYRVYTRALGRAYGLAARPDFIAALAAMAGVLIFDTLPGLFLGIAISLLLLVYRVSRPNVAVLGRVPGTADQYVDVARHPEDAPPPGVVVLRVESGLFVANAEHVRDTIRKHVGDDTKAVVIDAETVPYIDVSAGRMLEELAADLQRDGVALVIARDIGQVRDVLRQTDAGEPLVQVHRMLTPPPSRRLKPMTAVSGMPSSTMPRTIAGAEPAACAPPESLRSAPPRRSMTESPTKKVSAPANRPKATPPLPADVVTASSTRSKATALMSTPAPKAMMRPRARREIGRVSARAPPTASDDPATSPQSSASAIYELDEIAAAGGGVRTLLFGAYATTVPASMSCSPRRRSSMRISA